MRHPFLGAVRGAACEWCEENRRAFPGEGQAETPAVVRLTLTNVAGEVLDVAVLCLDCAREARVVGLVWGIKL